MTSKFNLKQGIKKYYPLGLLFILIFGFVLIQTAKAKEISVGTASDNIGIGTSAPGTTYRLNVNGNSNITGTLNVTGGITGGSLSTTYLSAGNVSAGAFGSNSGGGNYSFPGAVSASTFSGMLLGTSQWNPDGDGPDLTYDDSNPTYNGKSFGAIINFNGDAAQDNALLRTGAFEGNYFQASNGFYIGGPEANGTQIINSSGGAYFPGNVGVGTTNPLGKLTVNGAIQAGVGTSNTTDISSWASLNANYGLVGPYGYWGIRTDTSEGINFDVFNGGSQRAALTILQNTNIGIGTTNPQVRLDVQGGTDGHGANIYGMWTPDGNSLIRNWALNDGTNNYGSAGQGSYTTVSDAPMGSKTMRYSTNTYIRNQQWIPVDITKTYKVSLWGRTISGTPNNYISLTQATYDLSQPVNGGWGNPYWGRVNEPFPTTWTYYSMTIGPSGSGANYSWSSDTRYVQLGALMIYTGSGVCELTGYKIEEVPNTIAGGTTALGNLTVNGTISGAMSGTLNAANLSAGTFGANTGGGNYTFPGKIFLNAAEGLGVYGIRGRNTNEQIEMYNSVSIGSPNGWNVFPQAPNFGLSVYGGANFATNQGSVGIGLTGPGKKLDVAGDIRARGNIYTDNDYGNGLVGVYASTRLQGVYSMGDAYKLAADGTSAGNLYGLAWSHPNAGGVASNLNTHGLLVMENGTFLAAISGSIRSRDDMQSPIFYDRNDTSYYMDPNSTSRLNNLTVTGSITGNISNADTVDGLHAGQFFQYTNWISAPGADANTLAGNRSSFTYSNNSPWTGPIVRFDSGNYDLELNGNYSNGTTLSYRIKNGDANSWNSWYRLYSDTYRPYADMADNVVTPTSGYKHLGAWGVGRTATGAILVNTAYRADYADSAGNADTVDGQHFAWSNSNNDPTYVWAADSNGNSYLAYRPALSVGRVYGIDSNPDGSHPGTGIRPFYSWNKGQANNASSGYSNGISIGSHPGDQSYGFQIVQNMWDDNLYFRRYNAGWQTWYSVVYKDSANNSTIGGQMTAGGFIYNSDIKLKKNIATIESPLTKILQLRGVTFNWKKDNTPGVGLIAQEVEKVFPELVSESGGIKSVQYGNLVAPLIEAVKEQQTEIQNQQTQINEMKAQIQMLQAKN